MANMLLKIMGNDSSLQDDDFTKPCKIIANINEVDFKKIPTGEHALTVSYTVPNRGLDSEVFVLNSNAYLMNESGKTIQCFRPSQTVLHIALDENDPNPQATIEMAMRPIRELGLTQHVVNIFENELNVRLLGQMVSKTRSDLYESLETLGYPSESCTSILDLLQAHLLVHNLQLAPEEE